MYGMCWSKWRQFHFPVCRFEQLLGSGQFGEVFKGEWVTPWGTQEVAIKNLTGGYSEEDRVKFLQEAAIMAQFRHPHIVRLLGAVTMDEPVGVRGCVHLMKCTKYSCSSCPSLAHFSLSCVFIVTSQNMIVLELLGEGDLLEYLLKQHSK